MEQLMTILLTVVSGVLVYIIGEYIKNSWLDALRQYKELKYSIASRLCLYANLYSNPVDIEQHDDRLPSDYAAASDELRIIATKLRAFIEVLPCIRLGIPSKKTLYQASKELIGLSNDFSLPYNRKKTGYRILEPSDRADTVSRLLRIYPYKRKDD